MLLFGHPALAQHIYIQLFIEAVREIGLQNVITNLIYSRIEAKIGDQPVKVEFAVKQKKGLPFIMASTVLWTIMLIAFLTDLNVSAKNMIAMCCSALLMPVGMLFGKILKVDMFCKDNPFSSLSVVAALNQLMYLPIVLWTMYAVPDKMIMVYAIVVGAHFLPYYWIYFSPTYFYASIIIPIVSLMFGIYFSQIIVCVAFVAFDILICILLCLENKQAKKHLKAIANKE